jgi:hypothetical protein
MVFIYTLISYFSIIYIRYRLVEKILRFKYVSTFVVWYCLKYKKWKVYVGWNGYGFAVFNKEYKTDPYNLQGKENWHNKVVVSYWIMRAK